MKLKTFLTIVMFDNRLNFFVENSDYDIIDEFFARCDSKELADYYDYWVTFFDFSDNSVYISVA